MLDSKANLLASEREESEDGEEMGTKEMRRKMRERRKVRRSNNDGFFFLLLFAFSFSHWVRQQKESRFGIGVLVALLFSHLIRSIPTADIHFLYNSINIFR